MNKASLLASATVASLMLGALPVHAQNAAGPFADVPTDHWAYSAVDKLQKAGIVIGYPDQTYGGKRAMTRYEFAVAIARLLEKIPTATPAASAAPLPTNLVTTDQLNQALVPYALKSDLAGFAKQSDVDQLRRLVQEFQTELTTLGVDLDAVKRRLDNLEGRVKAIETELKRVQVGGAVNIYGRANNRFGTSGGTTFADADGYHATSDTANGNLGSDTRVLHDFDLNVKARLSDKATAETIINFGNYESFLGSISSYSGARSNRAVFAAGTVSQDEITSVYKAEIDVPLHLIGVGGVDFGVGRIPIQFTPYTLKLIDVDTYFSNDKTDLGDIPMDGAKARFNLGPVTATGFAAKVDPIQFISNENGTSFSSQPGQGYGLYAGTTHAPFSAEGTAGGFRGSLGGASSNRPLGSLINPYNAGPGGNGAMEVEQMTGVRANLGTSSLGTLGGTLLYMSGQSLFPADPLAFDRVLVYSGDANTHLGGIALVGSYNASETYGSGYNAVTQTLTGSEHSKITKDNYAWDAAGGYGKGAFSIKGGYKYISPLFAAPGYWEKIGAWTNPVDLKGPYVEGKYTLSNQLALVASGKFYQGTGTAEYDGGLTTDDKVQSLKAGLKYGVTSASAVDLGIERTEYTLSGGAPLITLPNQTQLGYTSAGQTLNGKGAKPLEYFYNIGYGYSFNPATSFKLLYQIVDYRDKSSGFDTFDAKGGVAAVQFSVKF